MNKHFLLLIILLALLLVNCSTYSTYYGPTYTTAEQQPLKKIHRIDLSHQNLTMLPKWVDSIPHLKRIDLSNNPNLYLENTITRLGFHTQLEVLLLDSLQLKEIPKNIASLKNLKHLSLAYNPTLNMDITLQNIASLPLVFLNLKGNQLTDLPKSITQLTILKDLNLSSNHIITDQSYRYLGELPHLYSLWLDHNKLDTLPTAIQHLQQIRYLYLDHNSLTYLPDVMHKLDNLWVLHAGHNMFNTLPEVLIKMPSLILAHFNNALISKMPKAFETEKYALQGIILDHNPLSKSEKAYIKNIFKDFFLLSFEQQY